MKKKQKNSTVLPGFGLSLGYSIIYLSLIVLIPLSVLFLKTSALSSSEFWHIVLAPRVMAAYKLTFYTSFIAAVLNAVFGTIIAWVLVRYSFPCKRLIDGLVDLPFALPTAVAGISLTAIYSPSGWIGQWLAPLGIQTAFNSAGIIIALTFIGLPFVVRSIQPVLQDLDEEFEEAATTLGASKIKTFLLVIFPPLIPALFTGFALAFARSLGEYGSVVFIAGNMPMKTEITPLLIMTKLEQFDYVGAAAIASVMLVLSFLILLLINFLQWVFGKKYQL